MTLEVPVEPPNQPTRGPFAEEDVLLARSNRSKDSKDK